MFIAKDKRFKVMQANKNAAKLSKKEPGKQRILKNFL
jgi:hypothetical protein